MSRITVLGSGYVGLTAAACFADLGNDVVGVDARPDVVSGLQTGRVHFYEPGLSELIERNMAAKRLRFASDCADPIRCADFIFIAVGTPMGPDGDADLTQVHNAAQDIAANVVQPVIVVNKSTVPIGTVDVVAKLIAAVPSARHLVRVVSNPEFLREGSAIQDFMEPDRVVLGAHDAEAASRVAGLYEPLGATVIVTTPYTAEMIKYASNAFLATKISFINEIARICGGVGADVKEVARGMGLDTRIGPSFLDAGLGYGGSCFPKDVMALAQTSRRIGAHPQLLHAVMQINQSQPQVIADAVTDVLGSLQGCAVGVLGLSFKPNTSDMREAPSMQLISHLLSRGASVRAFDPAAMPNARKLLPGVDMCADPYDAAHNADAVVVATEWNEFRHLDFKRLRRAMRRPLLVDARNIYEPDDITRCGFTYIGVGR